MEQKLTAKQEDFARIVGLEDVSLSDAYRRTYSTKSMKPETTHSRACELAADRRVAARIAEYRSQRVEEAKSAMRVDIRRLADIYCAIALTDPNELISQRVGACRHCWGDGGLYQWKEREYLEALTKWERAEEKRTKGPAEPMPDIAGGFGYRFSAPPNPDCDECEGEGLTRVVPLDTTKLSLGARHLYRGIQQTKQGNKLLFADQDAALEKIGRMLGAFDDKLRLEMDAKISSYKLTTADPREAAQTYAQMIDGAVKTK